MAAITGVDRKIIGVSRTFLAIDGSNKAALKPSRLFTGTTKGGAVRLGPIIVAEPLVIGEGIETVLSAMRLWGYSGGWAALSANGLRSVALPPEARSILIVVDNDANGIGQAAARDAAWLWEQEGRDVRVALPPAAGTDFNDILRSVI